MRSRNRLLTAGGLWTVAAAVALAQGAETNPRTGLPNYGRALFGAAPTRPAAVTPRPAVPTPTPAIRQAAADALDESPTVTADYGVEAGAETNAIVPAGATADGPNPFAAFEQGLPSPPVAAPAVPAPSVAPTPAIPAVPTPPAPAPTAKVTVTPTYPAAAGPGFPAVPVTPSPVVQTSAQTDPTTAPVVAPAVAAPAVAAPAVPVAKPAAPAPPIPAAAVLGLPLGSGSGANIEAAWERDGDIHVGEACTFRLVVRNGGDKPAGEVVVDATIPAALELTDAGTASVAGDGFRWSPGPLGPGAVKSLTVTAVPASRGEIELTAVVTTRTAATETFAVAEPLVEVVVEGPDRVMIGDPAPYTIVIKNPGTGTAEDITIEALIPTGLEHSKGARLAMGIGSLTPGESRVVRLPLTAIDGGQHAVTVVATAGERLRSEAAADVFIITPSLKLALDGPGLRYVGRTATYTLTVTNDGSAPNSNVRVTQQIPEGFAFVRADGSGRFDSVTRQAKWFLGRLDAGESRELKLELSAERLGSFVLQAATISEHGARSDASVTTLVDGTPSLTMHIVDLDDPVEVGAETAYEIRVKNEGTKAASNVATSCKLPAGVSLVEATGATDSRAEGQVVFFRPLGTLRPGQSVSYRVRVKGRQAGNQRFRVRLSSDSITEPLIFEELTKFYAD